MTIELSNWFHEGVLMQGGILSIDRAYFDISGGRERWLYKVARKHAGGAGEAGFAISLPTLFEKSGAEGQYRRFKFEIAKIAERNELPGYAVTVEQVPGKREPALRIAAAIRGRHRTHDTPSERAGGSPTGHQTEGRCRHIQRTAIIPNRTSAR